MEGILPNRVDVAEIYLWGSNIGAVSWDSETGTSVFEFEKGFVGKGLDVAPL
jgi:serine/threonine-protein kinase HipA